MAYDEELAERLRAALAGEDAITERAMFGGLGFMLHGNMAVAASSTGGLMVRVDPEGELHEEPHAEPMVMRGRPMAGWLLVAPAGFASDADLARWVERGTAYARTLPAKG